MLRKLRENEELTEYIKKHEIGCPMRGKEFHRNKAIQPYVQNMAGSNRGFCFRDLFEA